MQSNSAGRQRRALSAIFAAAVLGAVVVVAVVVVVAIVAGLAGPRSSAPNMTPSSARPCKLAVLGDSWAEGVGADEGAGGAARGFPGLTARALGCAYSSFAGGGTGYTTGSEANKKGPYSSRASALIRYDPTVVIVQGSSNDYRATEPQIQAAALALFTQLRTRLPAAKIYALGVIDSPASPRELNDRAQLAVERAAVASHVTYISGDGWLDIDTDFFDGYHPNDAGHHIVARHLAEILQSSGGRG